MIGADGESYLEVGRPNQIEAFDRESVQLVTYEHDAESGALTREAVEEYAYRGQGAHIDPTSAHHVTAAGSGMVELVEPWRRRRRTVTTTSPDDSGRVASETEGTWGWRAPLTVAGPYHWGGEQYSAQRTESWGLIRHESKRFAVETSDSYVEVVAVAEAGDPDDGTVREIHHIGQPPTPRYRVDPWIRLVSESLELAIDAPLLAEWFGPSTTVIADDHVETLDEAVRLVRAKLARDLAHQHTVSRPITLGSLGQTVRLIDPDAGLDVRALIVGRELLLDPIRPQARGVYLLESPAAALAIDAALEVA